MPYYIAKYSGRQLLSRVGPFRNMSVVLCVLDKCLAQEQTMETMRKTRPELDWYQDIAWEIQGVGKEGTPEGDTATFLRLQT